MRPKMTQKIRDFLILIICQHNMRLSSGSWYFRIHVHRDSKVKSRRMVRLGLEQLKLIGLKQGGLIQQL
jgi:hypothetical protein